jgi:hypothetical protein
MNETHVDEYNILLTSFGNNLSTSILLVIEHLTRLYGLILHGLYFYYVYKVKKFNTNKLMYLHHVNLISFLFCIHCSIYLSSTHPNTSNEALCLISEAFWIILKFLRGHSILQLAVYQYIAAFKPDVYINFSKSKLKIHLSLVILWLISIFYYTAIKFSFKTGPDYLFCYDGYSTDLEHSIYFYIVGTVLCTLTPISIVIVLYYLIHNRIKRLARRSHKIRRVKSYGWFLRCTPFVKYLSTSANQFLFMNISILLSSATICLLSIGNLMVEFDEFNLNYRQIMRILTVIFLSLIPLSSLIYHHEIVNARQSVRRRQRVLSTRF